MPRDTRKLLASPKGNKAASGGSGRPDSNPDISMVNAFIPSQTRARKPRGLDDVQKIFKLGIQGFKAAKDHTSSRSTRAPGLYDKHLDKCLRPTKVAYCPDLNSQIAEIADRQYQEYLDKFGSPPRCRSTKFSHIQHLLKEYGTRKVKLEDGILHHYAKVIPDITLPIVSALAFETPSWKPRYLEWTQDQQTDKAIVDASLRIDPEFPPPDSANHNCPYASLDQESERPLSEEDKTPILNCSVCDHPLMQALKDVARYFPCITLYEFKNLLAGSYEHLIALLEMTCDDIVHWEECVRRTCEHDTINFRVTGRKTGFDAAYPIVRLKAGDWRKTSTGLSLRTSKPHVVLEDRHRSSAKRILQQIWSEMVNHDATFLALSCGNIDMIFVRNRAEGILYLGDPIRTAGVPLDSPEPGYIQMLVGLSIASIRDAIDRAAQLKACEEAGELPLSWTMYTQDDHRVEDDEPDLGPVDIVQLLSKCQELSLVPKKGSGLKKRARNLYQRYLQEEVSYSLRLQIRIEPIDEDDNIFIGVVKWKKKLLKNRVIVKTARGEDATRELFRESCIFRSLMDNPERCKIPFMYGFFVDANSNVPYAVMLEQYAGNQLSDKPSRRQRISLKRTLKYAGEMGYEYSDIDTRSVVAATAKNSGNGEAEVYLVGLSRMKPSLQGTPGSKSSDNGLLSTLDREFKHRKKNGPCIHLGPVRRITTSPTREFQRITAWVKKAGGQANLLKSARCIGWVVGLPDWLEISILQEDAHKFEELWSKRPDNLRRTLCVQSRAWCRA